MWWSAACGVVRRLGPGRVRLVLRRTARCVPSAAACKVTRTKTCWRCWGCVRGPIPRPRRRRWYVAPCGVLGVVAPPPRARASPCVHRVQAPGYDGAGSTYAELQDFAEDNLDGAMCGDSTYGIYQGVGRQLAGVADETVPFGVWSDGIVDEDSCDMIKHWSDWDFFLEYVCRMLGCGRALTCAHDSLTRVYPPPSPTCVPHSNSTDSNFCACDVVRPPACVCTPSTNTRVWVCRQTKLPSTTWTVPRGTCLFPLAATRRACELTDPLHPRFFAQVR